MSHSMKQLIEKVQNDPEMESKFRACKSAAGQAKLANELGYEVTAEEFEQMKKELSDGQLDQVAGGSSEVYIERSMNKDLPKIFIF